MLYKHGITQHTIESGPSITLWISASTSVLDSTVDMTYLTGYLKAEWGLERLWIFDTKSSTLQNSRSRLKKYSNVVPFFLFSRGTKTEKIVVIHLYFPPITEFGMYLYFTTAKFSQKTCGCLESYTHTHTLSREVRRPKCNHRWKSRTVSKLNTMTKNKVETKKKNKKKKSATALTFFGCIENTYTFHFPPIQEISVLCYEIVAIDKLCLACHIMHWSSTHPGSIDPQRRELWRKLYTGWNRLPVFPFYHGWDSDTGDMSIHALTLNGWGRPKQLSSFGDWNGLGSSESRPRTPSSVRYT